VHDNDVASHGTTNFYDIREKKFCGKADLKKCTLNLEEKKLAED
jgi:hypothetical protein